MLDHNLIGVQTSQSLDEQAGDVVVVVVGISILFSIFEKLSSTFFLKTYSVIVIHQYIGIEKCFDFYFI